jgi:molybdopterin synthase catalytic subunit
MIRLAREAIDVSSLRDSLLRNEDGAVAIFEGVVRDNARGKRVRYLEYHAYEPMALSKLEEIAERARREFSIREIGIIHRLGRLELGECSVAIVVTSAHRAPAFEACRFAIDTLKKTVPIWKKEFYEDGEIWIEGDGATGD